MGNEERKAKAESKKEKRLELSRQYQEEKALRKERNARYKHVEALEKESRKAEHVAPGGYFLSCVGLNKIYANRVQAVYDFNLNVKEGEFIVLVGPSGCGKSTTLRMIAGLEDITLGELFIDGKYANALEPKQRGVAMVFQSYALYPHLSVFENLAFGLKGTEVEGEKTEVDPSAEAKIKEEFAVRLSEAKAKLRRAQKEEKPALREAILQLKIDKTVALERARKAVLGKNGKPVIEKRRIRKGEIASRIQTAAEALQITPYLFRKPTQLSGGQCQRVALGRAMVRNARVFLLDEPLSNLDAKLRVQMRSELVKLHEELGTTMLYVTHDQTEAMTMADRIVVMKDGLIQQIGTPLEVYQKPSNIFVATFIGSPTMNIRKGKLKDGILNAGEFSYPLNATEIMAIKDYCKRQIERIEKVRGEEKLTEEQEELLRKEKEKDENYLLTGELPVYFGIRPEDIVLDGEEESYEEMEIECKVSELLGAEYYLHFDYLGEEMVAKVPNKSPIAHGAKVKARFKKAGLHLFDFDTEERIF